MLFVFVSLHCQNNQTGTLYSSFLFNHLLVCPHHRHVFTASAWYSKTITSPSYPSNSDSNLNCNWLLEVDSSLASDKYIVKVTFSDLEVACDDDAVKFYDGDNITVSDHRSYCGTTHPDVIYSTGRYLFVNFYTDNDYYTYKGFNFSFSAVKKGIVLSAMDRTVHPHGSLFSFNTYLFFIGDISSFIFKDFSNTAQGGLLPQNSSKHL